MQYVTRKERNRPLRMQHLISLGSEYFCCREVVERRVYTVTGQRPGEEEVEQLIETGESETIFQKAILERGRGQVRDPSVRCALGCRTCVLTVP